MKDTPNLAQVRQAYVRAVLDLYLATPGVLGRIRRADRELAGRLFERRVPLYSVENALILAAARRVKHNAFATPLPPVRSLHYFLEPIQEVLDRPPGPRDVDALRQILAAATRPW
jgi:hypothetical protein